MSIARKRAEDTAASPTTSPGTQPTEPTVADSHDRIRVQGARENNLKDITLEISKRRLTVFTGVSGSGKSSLVFGTIAAESQRMTAPADVPQVNEISFGTGAGRRVKNS